MEGPFQFVVYAATAFSALSPLIFISIRESIKRQRQEIITDLASVFDAGEKNNLHLIPSFEFVKYKYFVGARRSQDPETSRSDISRKLIPSSDIHRKREDYSTISWLIACFPLSILGGIVTFYALSILILLLADQTSNPEGLVWQGVTYPKTTSFGMIWLLGICAAFAASFMTALRNLHRAVRNFDLSPGSIVAETIKILSSMVLAPVLAVSVIWFGTELVSPLIKFDTSGTTSAATAVVIAVCFVAGIMPDVALRYITHRDQLKNFKREENNIFQAFKITPVEIIDGIDSEIRVRLEEHHIHSTQNLAAANPLMLFVETPYGVYQIMDWVAQAQLCCSVGRDKIIKLWSLGVRTLFDLERLAGGTGETNEALLLEVGRIILDPIPISSDPKDRVAGAALVKRSIELRLDDPHVQRLRQIYIAVGDRLGSESRRFRTSGYRILCRDRKSRGWTCKGFASRGI